MAQNTLTQITGDFKLPQNEKDILQYWSTLDLYRQVANKNKDGETFYNLDGPPFVSSDNLHFGHVHIGIMKSFLVNYMNMHGKNVLNKIGYDVHGLPIEQAVSKLLGLSTNQDIKNYGLGKYNEKCEEVIKSYSGAWEPVYNRIGRFVDFNNEYKTMDHKFMETVWWAWKTLWEKDLVYRGYRIMPYSTACGTSLSASEASGDDVYKEVTDTAAYVKFHVKGMDNTFLVAWTTTPWTLPSNLSLAVNSNLSYVKVMDLTTSEYYILAKECLDNLYPKSKKDKEVKYNVIEEFLGSTLQNIEYLPLFNYFSQDRKFKVITAEFVQGGDGTGIVHLAPAFGQDDFDACIKNDIVHVEEVGNYCPIDDNGFVTSAVHDYVGMHVLDTNKGILERLKGENKLLKKEQYKHKYPHCWRTDTPLIYKAVSSFFIKVTSIKDKMVVNNKKVNWVPENIGTGRFKQWIENAKDWGVSRSRFFGTPIPVWVSDDGQEMVCVGSIDELVQLAGLDERPTNLHPQYINNIQIPSSMGKGMLKLCGDIFDCWFESGCVPFGQIHYPFENSDYFNNREYLSDFICEGLDQTRGWFYTLTVLSTALLDKPAFKNVICSGLILAEDGKKFSKRLGNFIPPMQVCDEYGSDALRLYLSGSPAAHAESFQFNKEHIKDINAKYFQLFNSLKFLIEHILKFEKDGNKLDLNAYKVSNNVTDKWILSRLRNILDSIDKHMKEYNFWRVKPEILNFIEDLTNWYIKFNRNRFRGRFCTVEDQSQSLSTLYHVMLTFSILSAPFLPFLSETIYGKLKVLLGDDERRDSVHLCEYPKVEEYNSDEVVERRMSRLQLVAGMVRSLRTKNKNTTSVKVPLKSVTIVNGDVEYLEDLKELERYMYDEINCLSIKYKKECGVTKYKIEPNHKEIGLKYRNKAVEVKNKLAALSQECIKGYVDGGMVSEGMEIEVSGEKITISKNYFSVSSSQEFELREEVEYSCKEENTIVVIDCTQDEDVMMVYMKRLIIVTVQKMRKDSGLRPWNKIGIYYASDSQCVDLVVKKYEKELEEELIYPVRRLESRGDEVEIKAESHVLNGHKVDIVITNLS
ncbi:Isoleucyl-tRNA synthetase [Orpheovirus IHUMI-LCC2]|uniref:isoleucine--tRNA ligase n=1 Tax=Orpheovirus IHUMI-LCC2 TaxID=2023057 RepID=A0A2I2L3Y0_9VIRU|nr:Isoleucyl-tRNA synthetase [Orpheovirus IHUMI-LCC2]SNW62233.1 Isoleucyl-tRNA synthetase [Orpheovirus IHUMI-LCC2]